MFVLSSEEFVERLAWRTTGAAAAAASGSSGAAAAASVGPSGSAAAAGVLDDGALQLHDAFVQAIKDLTAMHEVQKKKCTQLEQVENRAGLRYLLRR